MPFEKEPVFEFQDSDRKKPFTLKNNIRYVSKKDGTVVRIVKGYEFDGASIPKIFTPLVGCRHDERYLKAALVHDKLCDSRELSWQRTHQMFKEILLECNVSRGRVNVLYTAVILGGPKWR